MREAPKDRGMRQRDHDRDLCRPRQAGLTADSLQARLRRKWLSLDHSDRPELGDLSGDPNGITTSTTTRRPCTRPAVPSASPL